MKNIELARILEETVLAVDEAQHSYQRRHIIELAIREYGQVQMRWEKVADSLPADGTWCWVSDGQDTWPAIRYKNMSGGWTNGDTWEDFKSEVTHWQAVLRPGLPD